MARIRGTVGAEELNNILIFIGTVSIGFIVGVVGLSLAILIGGTIILGIGMFIDYIGMAALGYMFLAYIVILISWAVGAQVIDTWENIKHERSNSN